MKYCSCWTFILKKLEKASIIAASKFFNLFLLFFKITGKDWYLVTVISVLVCYNYSIDRKALGDKLILC